MARVIKCDDMYLAAVNRAGYKRDIRKFEHKLRLWNMFHRFSTTLMILSGMIALCMVMAVDDIEHEKLVWSVMGMSCLVLGVSVIMVKIPRPKLPIGVKIHQNKYIIAAAIYPGDEIVRINNDYVYEDGRKCKVIPCDVKNQNSTFMKVTH